MIVEVLLAIVIVLLGAIGIGVSLLWTKVDHLHDAVENQSKMCGYMSDKMNNIRIETLSKLDEIMLEIKEPPFDDGVELNKDSIEDLYTNDDGVYSRKAYLDKISIVHKK